MTATYVEYAFEAGGGTRLFARRWEPDRPDGAVVLIHGYGDHSGRYQGVADALNAAGCSVYAYDQRGHGRSPGKRAYIARFDALLEDLDAFLAFHRERLASIPWFLMGHSMGGMVLARFLQTRTTGARGAVFSSPFLGLNDDVPEWLKKVAPLLGALLPMVPAGRVDNKGLSRDPEAVRAADEDPLAYHGYVAARTDAEFIATIRQIQEAYGRITIPFLALHGSADPIVPVSGSRELYERAASADKTLRIFDGGYHELWNDLDKNVFFQEVTDWIKQRIGTGA